MMDNIRAMSEGMHTLIVHAEALRKALPEWEARVAEVDAKRELLEKLETSIIDKSNTIASLERKHDAISEALEALKQKLG